LPRKSDALPTVVERDSIPQSMNDSAKLFAAQTARPGDCER